MLPKYTNPLERNNELKELKIDRQFILPLYENLEYENGFGKTKHWHYLSDLFYDNILNAKKAYCQMLISGSIYYSLISIEYILKLKWCVYLNKSKHSNEADEFLSNKSKRNTFGQFINDKEKLKILNIEEFEEKLNLLNLIRNGLFHFNFENLKNGLKKLNYDFSNDEKKGWEVFYTNYIDSNLAKNIYNLLIDIVEKLYNIKK